MWPLAKGDCDGKEIPGGCFRERAAKLQRLLEIPGVRLGSDMKGARPMTNTIIHFRGKGEEHRVFPALPRRGDFLDDDGKLWRVAVVVFGATVDVYAVRLADALADDTRREWQGWGDVAAPVEPATKEQKGLFT